MTGKDDWKMQYIDERYEKLTDLGGEDSQTFLAKDKMSGRIVVKKYVTYDVALLYEKIRDIQNKYVVTVYEVALSGKMGIVITEFVSGITLREYMEERAAIAPDEVVRIIGELCVALEAIHKQDIIHRDLNPNNIILTGDGVVKLIDFGIAREVKENCACDTTILGTVGYAAPEQFGFMQSDERTDIFALGILMNVMLTGNQTGQQLYKEEPLASIIKKCTEIDPNNRFQAVSDLEKALEAISSNVIGNDIKGIIIRKGSRVKWLPGFRSGILWKNIIASLGYGFMILSTYIFLESYTVTLEVFLLESLAVFLYIWMSVLVIVNVANWDRKLPVFRKMPLMLRIIFRFIIGMIIFERGIAIENYVKKLIENLSVS